jgi:hypothetical protein
MGRRAGGIILRLEAGQKEKRTRGRVRFSVNLPPDAAG